MAVGTCGQWHHPFLPPPSLFPKPYLPHQPLVDLQQGGGEMQVQDGTGDLPKVESFISSAQNMEDELQMLGLKVKHHEDNLKYLRSRMNAVDRSVLDLQVVLGKFRALDGSTNETTTQNQTEHQTLELISQHTKTASSIICTMKMKHSAHMSKLPTTKGILGSVAMLGKVKDDNLSRLFSEYLGSETMLAIVCKTYEDVRALEEYDSNGTIDKNFGLHALGPSIGIPLVGRFLVICLENLRPYVGEFVAGDPQKRLEILKPRLPSGECPSGFMGFAVNMIDLEDVYLSCVTKSGRGFRETLFYGLFSRLQVYETWGSMQQALPYISDGAVSLDGGMVKSTGIFKLGSREDLVIKFPISSVKSSGSGDSSGLSTHIAGAQEKHRLLTWKKERLSEDIQREEILLGNVKMSFSSKQHELFKFQTETSHYVTQVVHLPQN